MTDKKNLSLSGKNSQNSRKHGESPVASIKLSELKTNDKNPRHISKEKFDKLKNSVSEFSKMMGIRPIVVDANNTIIAGNMRYKALKSLGLKTIPSEWVRKVTDFSEEEIRRFIIEDNVPFGEWDWDMLANDWDADELIKWGLDLPDYEKKEAEEDDYEEPEVVNTNIKLGDIIEIGDHRLMCGDSTKESDVAKLMDGKEIESVLTDPPYNIGFSYNGIDDKKTKEEYAQFCMKFFKIGITCKNIMIITPGPRNQRLYPEPTDIGIWLKKNGKSGATMFYLRMCEPILFYGKVNKKRNTDLFEFSSGFTKELKDSRTNNGVEKAHAPAKAIKLWSELINMTSGSVLDFFVGNGTSFIVAHQLNRKCYGMEIDPKYCQVVIDRMLNLDKTLEVKINGKKI